MLQTQTPTIFIDNKENKAVNGLKIDEVRISKNHGAPFKSLGNEKISKNLTISWIIVLILENAEK